MSANYEEHKMSVQIIYNPHDYVTVNFLNKSGEVIDSMPVPKDVDVERFMQEKGGDRLDPKMHLR